MPFVLAIGTRKGLFLATSQDRERWEVSAPEFTDSSIYAVGVDTRRGTPRILVSAQSGHFGPSVYTSDDLGKNWEESESTPPIAFPEDTGASFVRAWQFAFGPDPDVVYAGSEPQGLWRSTDGGRTYEMVRALWEHPHRPEWGSGFGGPAIHTILPHPTDASKVVIAMSTGGVYRTDDGGDTWTASNKGIRVVFAPDPYPEFGQCVHKVARDSGDPDRLFLQNHEGVYRSDDGGVSWTSIAEGLPSDFGFTMVTHPRRGGVAYNVPVEASMARYPMDQRLRVYRTENGGGAWDMLDNGLPQDPYYSIVLRDGMCADTADTPGLYLGTRNGDVYASPDEGGHFVLAASHLPDVLCVRAAEV